jgi:hypothetical protein
MQMAQGVVTYWVTLTILAIYTWFGTELTNQVICMLCKRIFELKCKEWFYECPKCSTVCYKGVFFIYCNENSLICNNISTDTN